MANDFAAELQSIVDAIDVDYRAETQSNVDALLGAGVQSRGDLLATLLDRSAGENRGHACWLLGRLEDVAALPGLIATLKDPDPILRSEAARALGSIGTEDAAAALIDSMGGDPDEQTRLSCVLALGAIGALSAIDPLLSVLVDRAESPNVRGAAAEALTGPRDARVVPALIAALADPVADVRFWSAFALGELADASAIPSLAKLAATDDAVVPGWWSVKEEAEAAIESIEASERGPDAP